MPEYFRQKRYTAPFVFRPVSKHLAPLRENVMNAEILDLMVTCADGLENSLAQELAELGFHDVKKERGVFRLQSDLAGMYRLCLWSRIASRVFMPLFSAPGNTPEALYETAVTWNWASVLTPAQTLAISATAARGVKVHTQYISLKLKDAVVDACRESFGERPSVATHQPDIALHVHAEADHFVVSLDLSGDSLHKRGYRVAMTDAPLKETLAAALLKQSGWPSQEYEALWDPMCGSGTFLIEAAWMAADIAPGILRDYYGFLGWRGHDDHLWQQVFADAIARRDQSRSKSLPILLGSDANDEALNATLRNAKAAGVAQWLDLSAQSLYEATVPAQAKAVKGLVITNPPYGERLGEKASNRDLYRALGRKLMQQVPNWQACILAADITHVDHLGLVHKATERLHNGALIIYARHAEIPAWVNKPVTRFVEAETELPEEAEQFANRLRKNLKAAYKHAERHNIYCYRVYDADMPEFNIAIDVYEDKLHVQEYAPPKTVDPEKAEARFKLALHVIRHIFGLQREKVFIKVRSKQKGKQQYEKQNNQGKFFEVREGQAWLLVNLTDYLDTGLFLDHRPMRQRIAKEIDNKHFLNLFAYTGVVSLQAALGGAATTTTVDLSPTYLSWAERNFALNGLPIDNHFFEQADCVQWLKACEYEFDVIFIDPPTFSNSKRTPDVFDVQEDHVELVWLAMRTLKPDGALYFSNNFRKFKLDFDALQEFIIEDISAQTIDFDFERNPNIHRCWKITHKNEQISKEDNVSGE